MPMPPYPIYCSNPECKNLAAYKIAAQWTNGLDRDLKTYGLVCDACLPSWFLSARQRHQQCRLAPGESLEAPAIFQLNPHHADRNLTRRQDLETSVS